MGVLWETPNALEFRAGRPISGVVLFLALLFGLLFRAYIEWSEAFACPLALSSENTAHVSAASFAIALEADD